MQRTNNSRWRQAWRVWSLHLLALAALLAGVLRATPLWAQDVEAATAHRADMSAQLQAELAAASEPVSFLIILTDQPDTDAIVQVSGAASDPVARRQALYASLTAQATASQAALRAWLEARGVTYRPFYLVNMLEVTGDLALAEELRLRPEVDRLARNPALAQSHTTVAPPLWPQLAAQESRASAAMPYGLAFTKADQVWAMGYRGQGIVVASQDTGVEWDHPALQPSYRGWISATMTATHTYNWFDAFGRNGADAECPADPQVPCDDNGHGTHTVGTMLGDATAEGGTILGMAPDAAWIACRNMREGVGTPASYTDCFQFFVAPYPQGGDPFTDGRPELAPHVINNSWGCPPSEGCDTDSLRQVVETTRAAGLFVAASAGNVGFLGCSSILDPIAIYDASFTVGAHNSVGTLADFSSRGPVTADGSGRRKPDLTAPGVAVYSTYPSHSYTYLQGTSMASPHVAGAVALLWSAAPSLVGEIDQTEQILLQTAVPVASAICSGGAEAVAPNNLYGFGWLDVEAAVELASQPSSLTVQVKNANNLPQPGAVVVLVERQTKHQYTLSTDSSGHARWGTGQPGGPIFEGKYDIQVDGGCGTRQVEIVRGGHSDEAFLSAVACMWLPEVMR